MARNRRNPRRVVSTHPPYPPDETVRDDDSRPTLMRWGTEVWTYTYNLDGTVGATDGTTTRTYLGRELGVEIDPNYTSGVQYYERVIIGDLDTMTMAGSISLPIIHGSTTTPVISGILEALLVEGAVLDDSIDGTTEDTQLKGSLLC